MPGRVLIASREDNEKFGFQFLGDIIRFIGERFYPDDVFDKEKLEDWAEENGWSQEE